MAKSAKSGRAPAPAPAMVDDPAKTNSIIVGKSTKFEVLDLHFGNRHGLVTGATGTGKTVTLQVLAEGLSEARRFGLCRRHQRRSLGHRRGGRGERCLGGTSQRHGAGRISRTNFR